MAKPKTVTLIGFQDQGNLGIGYLAGVLDQHGFAVQILEFRQGPERILEAAKSSDPLLVGFSLIFQFYLPQFAELAAYLRRHGINAHFSVGGHYPSLRAEDTLETIPELDSVVRFEGEFTLLELVSSLDKGLDWHSVPGLAYLDNGQVKNTETRPLVSDLDQLPYPVRTMEPEKVLGISALPMLATRGCPRTCTFCSIIKFYREVPGKAVRRREPQKVVEEMKSLHEERGISIFLIQDDDFPLLGNAGRRWVDAFIRSLHSAGLYGHVAWKINCRADEVQTDLFLEMRDAGLYVVYMGLESGTDEGLKAMSKQTSVEDNLHAVSALKRAGLLYEFGFMMFDPSSTFESVRGNTAFLRQICGDGSAAVSFCKMLPYAGTPVEEELRQAGRLRGDVSQPDYSFLDAKLQAFYENLSLVVAPWVSSQDALSPKLNWALHEVAVMERFFPHVVGLEDYGAFLKALTSKSNGYLLSLVEEGSFEFEEKGVLAADVTETNNICRSQGLELITRRNQFVEQNQDAIVKTLERRGRSRFGNAAYSSGCEAHLGNR